MAKMDLGNEPVIGTEPYLYGRDIARRIAWLEDTDDEDEQEELKALQEFMDQIGLDSNLIHESRMAQYAEEYARDTGSHTSDWPYAYIDWEGAAEALMSDMNQADLFGATYYFWE